jgi:hypothetical protein
MPLNNLLFRKQECSLVKAVLLKAFSYKIFLRRFGLKMVLLKNVMNEF